MASGGGPLTVAGTVEEVVLCGLVPRLDGLTAALPSTPALMIVEQIPAGWLDAETRDSGIRFEHFEADQPIPGQTRGRIFGETFEFRWEPGKDGAAGIRVRSIGAMTHLEGLEPLAGIDMRALEPRDGRYDLWGERVDDPTLIGQPSDALIYAELRIPRMLRYPASGRPRRIRLRVREYVDPTTNVVVLARFSGLEE